MQHIYGCLPYFSSKATIFNRQNYVRHIVTWNDASVGVLNIGLILHYVHTYIFQLIFHASRFRTLLLVFHFLNTSPHSGYFTYMGTTFRTYEICLLLDAYELSHAIIALMNAYIEVRERERIRIW